MFQNLIDETIINQVFNTQVLTSVLGFSIRE